MVSFRNPLGIAHIKYKMWMKLNTLDISIKNKLDNFIEGTGLGRFEF